MIEPFSTPLSNRHLRQCRAGDRCCRRVLAGMADAEAVIDAAVERIGGRNRNAVLLRRLDDVVIGAGLRRRHDQAVDGRILDDLVEDFDFAGRIVGRQLRAEQQDLGADHVAGDGCADIDRVEEAVASRMRDDGEGQMAVGGVEILGALRLLGGVLETIAADSLADGASFLGACATRKQHGQRECTYRHKQLLHGSPPVFVII